MYKHNHAQVKKGHHQSNVTDAKCILDAKKFKLLGVVGNDSHDRPTVYVADYLPTSQRVAVKRINLDMFPHQLEQCQKDMFFSQNFSHTNIRKCYGYFLAGTEYWMVMPFMSAGSAWRVMQYGSRPGFDEPTIANVKASSILLDQDASVNLCDFRDSVNMVVNGIRSTAVHKYDGTAATIPWMAPEILDQDLYGYDQKADMYSIGITALELANNHAPYSSQPPTKVLLLKMNGTLTTDDFLGPHPRRMSKHLRNIINICLHRDPRRRPTAVKLLQHSFFKNSYKKKSYVASVLQSIPALTEHLPPRSQYLVHQIISSGGNGELIMGQAERREESNDAFRGLAVPVGPAYEAPAWNL
eukprot:CFRG5112T1